MGRPRLAATCAVNDGECTQGGRYKRGLCIKHYGRMQKFGSADLETIAKTCAWCGSDFDTSQSRARFCGTRCRDRERYARDPARREASRLRERKPKPRKPRKPHPLRDFECPECGAWVEDAHWNRRYCSRSCVRRVAERTRADRRVYPMRAMPQEERDLLHEWARILRRDPCSYCGSMVEAIDHIHPVALGGEHRWSNLTGACHDCNRRKSAKPLLAFLAGNVG